MKLRPFFFLFAIYLSCSYAAAQNLTVRDIMAEPSIAGMRAEGEKLSPDGSKVIYLWNPEGKLPRDLYMVSTKGGPSSVVLRVSDLPVPSRTPEKENKLDYGLVIRDDFVRERENQLGNFEWSPDSKRLVFSYAGDMYLLTPGGKPARLTQTQVPETALRFLDNDRVLYSQNGNLFVWSLTSNLITQISRESNPQAFISVTTATPNKVGSLLAYVVSDSSKFKPLVVPNYLDEFVQASSIRRGWSEQKILVVPTDGSRDTPFEIKLPKPEGVSNFRRLVWAADNRSLIADRIDKDTKRRQLFYIRNVGAKDEQIILVTEETDEKWQAPLSSIVEPSPNDTLQLFFGSEKAGYNHIYLAKLEAETRPIGSVSDPSARVADGGDTLKKDARITQLTNGNWQVEWAKWSTSASGPNAVVYSSTSESGAFERKFSRLSIDASGKAVTERFDPMSGMKDGPQYEATTMIFTNSRWNSPGELFAIPNVFCVDCSGMVYATKLTSTTPKSWAERNWNSPKFESIRSRDGKYIPAKIYVPAKFSNKKKYPMVIFVHGAGYLQNVIDGWNNYYREFMFNQLLTQKGYVVVDIDYRGSAGYGRDWRTDVYHFLGGKDMDDHIDAIDYMVKNYSVNPTKVGVYGGSYGGFMAEMLAMRAPDKVAAAAALRPVADWKNYYASSPGYTAQRLGFPDKNPEAYKRSSPITYADKLERPLLILHGMSDDNVHAQDSIQLIEKLIRLGKTQYFETMLYPSENHAFVRPQSWTDEYERILAFFEKHLK